MIPVNSRTLGESEIVGGMAKLIEAQFKFKISAVDYNGEFLHDWEFSSQEEAVEAFNDLLHNVA
jgi:hypothetical protein